MAHTSMPEDVIVAELLFAWAKHGGPSQAAACEVERHPRERCLPRLGKIGLLSAAGGCGQAPALEL